MKVFWAVGSPAQTTTASSSGRDSPSAQPPTSASSGCPSSLSAVTVASSPRAVSAPAMRSGCGTYSDAPRATSPAGTAAAASSPSVVRAVPGTGSFVADQTRPSSEARITGLRSGRVAIRRRWIRPSSAWWRSSAIRMTGVISRVCTRTTSARNETLPRICWATGMPRLAEFT